MRNSLLPALLPAALAVGLLAVTPLASTGAEPESRPAEAPVGAVEEELVGERTASSRTYRLQDGRRLTKLFGEPVHYRGQGGDWESIDTSLVPRPSGGLGVAAAGFDLELPARAGGTVRVGGEGGWVEFALQGAGAATPTVDGATALYADVVDGVDLRYSALSSGLKESLVLSDRSAPSRFDFALEAAEGLRAVARDSGAIDLVGPGGGTQLSIAAPFMQDAAGAVSGKVDYRLEPAGQGWRLTLVADEGWLSDPARRYPVEVDPTVYAGAQTDCTLDASAPTTSLCSNDELKVGWDGTNDHRALLKFDVDSVLPKGGHVEEAYLAMYLRSKTGSASKDLGVYRMTRAWTSGASWNRYDGTNSWTSAGGDFDANLWRKSQLGTAPTGQYYFFSIGELVQGWRDATFANDGLVVKDVQDNTTNNLLAFGATERPGLTQDPYMGITWDPRLGEQRQFTLDRQTLSDRSELAVNVANGNLIYSANDVQVAGTGLDLGVSRTFNSLGEQFQNAAGHGWALSAGGGINLWPAGGGDRILFGPSGSRQVFRVQPNGSFKPPTAIDATLTAVGSGWKLHFDKTAVDWHFNSNGDLTSQEDRNGNEISYSFSAPETLDEITDTQGRVIETTYATGKLDTLEDWSGRVWDYGHDGYGHLTSYTDPDGKTTTYDYAGPENLVEITDPRGVVTKLEYDGDSRVTAIKRDYDSGTNTWTARTGYAYSSPTSPCNATTDVGKTIVTNPRGKDTTYCYDHEARVTKVVDPNGNTRSATYTPNSDPDTTTAPGPVSTTRAYAADNLTSVTQPHGEVTNMQYGTGTAPPRFLTQMEGAHGTITNYGYNAQGNLSTVDDNGSPAVQATLEYNGQVGGSCTDDPTTHSGTLRCAINPLGGITNYEYDDDGHLIKILPPSPWIDDDPLGNTEITYDSLSRVDTVEDGKGQTRSYSYDPLDRVTQIEYSNGDTVDYDHDENGNLLDRDDNVHGLSEYAYDELNRRIGDDLPSGDTDYAWDAASNMTSLTDPGGTVGYAYDDANRLTSLSEPGGSCTTPVSLCTTFTYTSRDMRDTTTYPNTVVQDIDYDSSDKVTRIKATKPGSPATTLTDYQYDHTFTAPIGESDLLHYATDKDNKRIEYAYDGLGRLDTAIEKASGGVGATLDSRDYDYDNASNITRWNLNGTVYTWKHNNANQLCWYVAGSSSNACDTPPAGAITSRYDENGNQLQVSNWVFAYNGRDQTTSWTVASFSPTTFAYAGPGQTERTATGGSTQHNTMLGLNREGSTEWTREPDGTLISQNAGGTRHYYLSDRLGSIVGLANSSGTLAQTYKHDPYGSTIATTGSVTNPFQYTGAYRSAFGTGGIYKMGARYYWAGAGRWFQQDPIDQAADLREGNRYVYSAADPINVVDPLGTRALRGFASARPKNKKNCPPGDNAIGRCFGGRQGATQQQELEEAIEELGCRAADEVPLLDRTDIPGC